MDFAGQEALLNAHVLIVGVGGLGCAVAQYLVVSGVGQLTLVDDDIVELSNLQRQVLHPESSLGQTKVSSAQQRLLALNADCQINVLEQRLHKAQGIALARQVDVLIDCSDNLATRELLNQISVETQTPLVTGAAVRMEGQVATFIPSKAQHQPTAPCYACYSRLFAEPELSCMEAGVLAPIVGIVGATQALEVVKLLTVVARVTPGRLMLLDAATLEWRTLVIKHYDQCSVCSK